MDDEMTDSIYAQVPVAAADLVDEGMVPMAELKVVRGNVTTDEAFQFAAPAVIGRFDPAVGPVDVDLGGTPEGSYVSRRHAEIRFEAGQWLIRDMGSSNGTYVKRDDFERVDECQIVDGDEIALGNARFSFHIKSGSVSSMADEESEAESGV